MRWSVELSPEVAHWYGRLSVSGMAVADRIIERLEAQGHLMRMPHSRSLGDGLFELRFMCEEVARRVTYTLEPNRMAITLTTFRKQRNNERREIIRARRALRHRTA